MKLVQTRSPGFVVVDEEGLGVSLFFVYFLAY